MNAADIEVGMMVKNKKSAEVGRVEFVGNDYVVASDAEGDQRWWPLAGIEGLRTYPELWIGVSNQGAGYRSYVSPSGKFPMIWPGSNVMVIHVTSDGTLEIVE